MKRTSVALLLAAIAWPAMSAVAGEKPVPIPERARGADAIVIGTVVDVVPTFERNAFGDQLIVSHTSVRVEQALKGAPPQVVSVDVEGGTIGSLTLKVSDLPSITRGDRAVFFLRRTDAGVNVPHLRHNGIIKITNGTQAEGGGTLNDVRAEIQKGLQ